MKNLKSMLGAGAVIATLGIGSALIGAGVKDTDGNFVTDETDWGDVDGRATKVIDIKNLIAPDYANVSNRAANAVVPSDMTNTVRKVVYSTNQYQWDAKTGVCYYLDFYNDYLTYVAVTNVDVRLPENYEALEACDELVKTLH